MARLLVFLLLSLQLFALISSEEGSTSKEGRNGKNLAHTFPFQHGDHDHHHHHHQEHGIRDSRQRQTRLDDQALDIGTIAAAGERCVDKVVMTEETEYDEVINCKHSYSERCHTTYKTDYTPQQEEECDENYRKSCYIEYKQIAFKEKVKFCFQTLVKNCNLPAPIECTTEYQSQCTTRYHEHNVEDDVPNCVTENEVKCEQVTQGYSTEERCTSWPVQKCDLQRQAVKKFTPETECKKVPFELCGPSACPVEPGPEQCQDKEETIVQEVPEEVCNLQPQRECKHVTKLVPRLEPHENCVDVPKEVCVRSRTNPRRIQKPVVKKWCYTPTAESGLVPGGGINRGDNNQRRNTPRPRPVTTPRPQIQGCLQDPRYRSNYCEQRIGDGRCDEVCNIRQCQYDGGDCQVITRPPPPPPPPRREGCLTAPGYGNNHCERKYRNRQCDPECNIAACRYDGGDCEVRTTTTRRPPPRPRTTRPPRRGCARGYPADYCEQRIGNGVCNPECNTSACRFDGGDCKEPPQLGYLPPPNANKYNNRRG